MLEDNAFPITDPNTGLLSALAKPPPADTNISPKNDNFCIQRPSNLGGVDGEDFFVGKEDCLYLDIFTPSKKSQELRPVMFWIHGGANTSGLKDLYDFSKMVESIT